jgi:phosphoribosylformylglycinamidine synthase
LIHAGLIRSAHDASDGGIIVALIESALCGTAARGFSVDLTTDQRMDRVLFGEDQSRIVVSAEAGNIKAVEEICARYGVPCSVIGAVTQDVKGVVKDCVTLDLIAARSIMANEIGQRMEEVFSAAD